MNSSENIFRYKSLCVSLSLVEKKFLQANDVECYGIVFVTVLDADGPTAFENRRNRHSPPANHSTAPMLPL